MEEQMNETRTQSEGDSLKSKATELAQEAKQRKQKQLDTTKKAAADQAQKVAGVIEQALSRTRPPRRARNGCAQSCAKEYYTVFTRQCGDRVCPP